MQRVTVQETRKKPPPLSIVGRCRMVRKRSRSKRVDMEVKNTGSEPESISVLLGVKIKNAANQAFDVDVTSGKEPGPPDVEIAPRDASRGFAVFDVPDAKEQVQARL